MLGIAVVPASAADDKFTIGATTLAKPASGGSYIYVDDSGSDWVIAPDGTNSNGTPYADINRSRCLLVDKVPYWTVVEGWSEERACPEPTKSHPLASIEFAIRVARPGDVIVVREGTYKERLGWGAVAGTKDRPIVLQNAPGERVIVKGRAIFKDIDYWRIEGLRWRWDKATTGSAKAIVFIYGGTGWTFTRNDVRYTHGVANLAISAKPGATTPAQRKAYAPHDYTISSNFIGYNLGTWVNRDHNIYLRPSIWSTGGVITHNLLVSAPTGSNIKVAGSKNANESPRHVKITYNTLIGGSNGVVFGMKSKYIEFSHNVIGLQEGRTYNNGGVKTFRLRYPKTINVTDNVISGYRHTVYESGAHTLADDEHIRVRSTVKWGVKYTGNLSGARVHFTRASIERNYGHNAGW